MSDLAFLGIQLYLAGSLVLFMDGFIIHQIAKKHRNDALENGDSDRLAGIARVSKAGAKRMAWSPLWIAPGLFPALIKPKK